MMKYCLWFAKYAVYCLSLCGVLVAVAPANGSEFYTYKRGEYVTITNSASPNHQFSVATHGDGENGEEDFHLFLMAEPAHKKIGPLKETVSANTHPLCFSAEWSRDSRHVAVIYRADTHSTLIQMYQIANRRAHLVHLPNLEATTKMKVFYAGRYHSFFELKWQNPHRFVLTESCRSEDVHDLTGLEKEFNIRRRYYRITKGTDNSNTVIFGAEAVCKLGRAGRCRVISVKPGRFDQWK